MKFLTTLVLATLASPGYAGTLDVDSDTIDIDGTQIRILNIDTPAAHKPRCKSEYALGLKAKARLAELLEAGSVTFRAEGYDSDQRTLATIYAGSLNVGQRLLIEGHVLPYIAGPLAEARRLAYWCGAAAADRSPLESAERVYDVTKGFEP